MGGDKHDEKQQGIAAAGTAPAKVAGPVQKPSVGRIVHYVVSDTGPTVRPDIRAMLITDVPAMITAPSMVNGSVYRSGPADLFILQQQLEVTDVMQDEANYKKGSWHWPKRV